MSFEGYTEFNSMGCAVRELDAYISSEENKFGIRIIRGEKKSKLKPEIIKSLEDLKSALRRDRAEREEAYEYLKKSNNTMKKIIEKLQDEMKLCRENINKEFINFDNLNTDRLLNINPKYLTVDYYSARDREN